MYKFCTVKPLKIERFLLLALSIVSLMGFSSAAHAGAATGGCGFNSVGDYTCSGTFSNPSGPSLPTSPSGTQIFNDTIMPIISTIPGASSCSTALAAMMALMPTTVNDAMTVQLLDVMASNPTGAEFCSFVDKLLQFQAITSMIPDTLCGGSALGNDDLAAEMSGAFTTYAYNAIAQNLTWSNDIMSMDLASMTSGICSQATEAEAAEIPAGTPTGAWCNGVGGSTNTADPNAQSTPTTSGRAIGTGSCDPVNPSTIDADIIAHLKLREGEVLCAYNDSLGKPTVGVGHLIKPGDNLSVGDCISQAQSDAFLQQDMQSAKAAAQAQMAQMGVNSHEFLVALVSVNYQLGTAWNTKKFPNTWQDLLNHNWAGAKSQIAGSLWASQTPTRTNDFMTAIDHLAACMSGTTPSPNTTSATPPTTTLPTDTTIRPEAAPTGGSPGDRIAAQAINSIGASTADHPATDGGNMGCALAVSRILECAGYSVGEHVGTGALYDALAADSCFTMVDTGHIDDASLQPGDVLVTKRGSRAGHTGVYVGNGNIVSNSSSGFQGSDPGTVQQNYTVDKWYGVTSRNPAESAVFRRTC